MTARRAIIGLCMISALIASAIAAPGAGALEVKGTTAFTCVKVIEAPGTEGFSKEHCKPEDAVTTNAKFQHVAIAEGTATEITGSNEKTNIETEVAKLKETIAGVATELQATAVHGEGTFENLLDTEEGAHFHEHYAHAEGTLTYTGVTVTKPAGKGCKVWTDNGGVKGEEGVVHTNLLTGTTTGQGHSVTITPKEGNVFATFIVECTTKVPAIEGTWKIEGKVTGVPNGATINFTHGEVTEKETLIGKGAKAGIEGTLTIKGRDPKISGDGTKPLSVTTVET
jgi:hypothetical protein